MGTTLDGKKAGLQKALGEYWDVQRRGEGGAPTLVEAEQTAGKYRDLPGTARMFRAMNVFQQGRADEARELYNQAVTLLPPFPADTGRPVIGGKIASHDVIIGWLAGQEAKSLIFGPTAQQ